MKSIYTHLGKDGLPRGLTVLNNLPANAGGARDAGSVLGSGRSPGVGNGNPVQYSCLENSMDRGGLWATIRWVAKELDRTEHSTAQQHLYIKMYIYIKIRTHIHGHRCMKVGHDIK